MAAQYGQTAFLYHVALRWDADVDAQDADGRTPLHWAAYKGFGDTIRLLLVMDARWGLADREGCTPLHWAAIRGNAEACTLLLQVRHGHLPLLRRLLQNNQCCVPEHQVWVSEFSREFASVPSYGTFKSGATSQLSACRLVRFNLPSLLIQGGSESLVHQPDATGSTPPQLAMDKGHRYLSRYLADFKRCQTSKLPALSPALPGSLDVVRASIAPLEL